MDDAIRIRGARQHNLKDIDLDIRRRALTVVTGPSGSGKSSLALDTLFSEGQRRYVESLSTYAKQFVERMSRPDVDLIEGLSPAVAIEQKNPTKTSRSTVGTATEVYDYLRLLWARVGRTHCPECGREVEPDTVTGAVDRTLELPEGIRIMVAFPLPVGEEITHEHLVENLLALGFVRVLAGGGMVDLGIPDADDPEVLGLDLSRAEEVVVVVDRLKVAPDARDRLADSLGTAFSEGEGEALVLVPEGERGEGGEELPRRIAFTERFRCTDHPEVEFLEPTPALFSFNNPYGSCPTCTGFGATLEYDLDLIIPDPERTLDEGAVDPWTKPRYDEVRRRLRDFARERDVSVHLPWKRLPEGFREEIIHGSDDFEGVLPFLKAREKKKYKAYIRVFLRQYQTPVVCRDCEGAKLRPEALRILIGGRTIAGMAALPIERLNAWLHGVDFTETEERIAEAILEELHSRLDFLEDVGLGYLTLSRQTRTLSGGEAQRINLANSLGAALVETLYVLDEPTIGLHPRDTGALLDLLLRLRAAGNTVLVVEHDRQALEAADEIVELGPASGERGGEVVFQGTPAELGEADTVTGRYFSGREEIPVPEKRRDVGGGSLVLEGARLHNLDGVDVEFPFGALTVVTGVSGSGKSTLVHDILYRALEHELEGEEISAKVHLGEAVGEYDALRGMERLAGVVLVDQSPIGRTPRSNPVTYIKAWGEIRELFAGQPLSRDRGYEPGHFSFNVQGGRCDACKGAGQVEVEMIFMPDVYVPCDACGGKRFKPEVLEVEYKGKSIADVLELTVDEAIRFFLRQDRLGRILWQLQQVGLGYLRLGQPAPTLSGGEAQRLKIARELAGAGKSGRNLYLLDEPTTGLSASDVRKLLKVFDRLLDAGNTVVVIEHDLDVVKTADWIIDLGPGAGERGGEVVATGRPEEVAGVPESETGRYIDDILRGAASPT